MMTKKMEKMSMKDLKNGYFVRLRNGEMGMVQGEVIVMKNGFFYMDYEYEKSGDEEDDLTSIEDEEYDVMRVYRPEYKGERLEFGDFMDGYYSGEWIYERDENWTPPTKEEREQKAAEEAAKLAAMEAEQKEMREEYENNEIGIIAQAFNGNRTGTWIDRKNVDRFILGHLDDVCKTREKIDRTIIRIPNTENLVMIYNKDQEERERKSAAEYFKEEGVCCKAAGGHSGTEHQTLQQMHCLQNECRG